ncbi:TRAP transporter small permease [Acuticoccus sp. MNP-M23]|uniref:TRAP transporter small permease n=1 Tax=Acuticoccus sp. MNP-M23 TaxID=3072793 RepID=UPI00281500BA|nr:TRAP transporter small permease [Acuticoccus sp. MNP-M23]WMS44244.1 TRAP transporter small permease [Acuticoccus sp. MNP-M23]
MASLLLNYPLLTLVGFITLYFIADKLAPRVMNELEEIVIALILAAMTLVAFVQVVMRYGFNSGFQGALELNRILFAWLILFGMSYAVKINSHLGIDSLIRLFPRPVFRGFAIFGALAVLLYAVMFINADWLKSLGATTRGGGAVDYWWKMYRVGIGLDDLKYPAFMVEMTGQDRVHRWVAYLILPIGLGLLAMRAVQALVEIIQGKRELIIASHEAEDLVEKNRNILKD